jgi:hypothetical protein
MVRCFHINFDHVHASFAWILVAAHQKVDLAGGTGCMAICSERAWSVADRTTVRSHRNLCAVQNEHPLAWKEEKEWLRGSPMAAKLAKRQAQVTSDTARLLEIGAGSLPCPTGSTDVLVSVENMTWAAATLLSRSFNLEMAPPKAPSALPSCS